MFCTQDSPSLLLAWYGVAIARTICEICGLLLVVTTFHNLFDLGSLGKNVNYKCDENGRSIKFHCFGSRSNF